MYKINGLFFAIAESTGKCKIINLSEELIFRC